MEDGAVLTLGLNQNGEDDNVYTWKGVQGGGGTGPVGATLIGFNSPAGLNGSIGRSRTGGIGTLGIGPGSPSPNSRNQTYRVQSPPLGGRLGSPLGRPYSPNTAHSPENHRGISSDRDVGVQATSPTHPNARAQQNFQQLVKSDSRSMVKFWDSGKQGDFSAVTLHENLVGLVKAPISGSTRSAVVNEVVQQGSLESLLQNGHAAAQERERARQEGRMDRGEQLKRGAESTLLSRTKQMLYNDTYNTTPGLRQHVHGGIVENRHVGPGSSAYDLVMKKNSSAATALGHGSSVLVDGKESHERDTMPGLGDILQNTRKQTGLMKSLGRDPNAPNDTRVLQIESRNTC